MHKMRRLKCKDETNRYTHTHMASHSTATTHIRHIATKRTHIKSFSHNCMSTWKRIALTSKKFTVRERLVLLFGTCFFVSVCACVYSQNCLFSLWAFQFTSFDCIWSSSCLAKPKAWAHFEAIASDWVQN